MIVSQRQAATKSYKRYDDAFKRPVGLIGTDTGLHDLNMITGGHLPTKITTFAGRSGLGKSGTLIPLADAAGRIQNGRRSELMVLSWEMESSYLIDRYICWKTGLKLLQLRYPKQLTEYERTQITEAYRVGSALPVHYHQNAVTFNVLKPDLEDFINKTSHKSIVEGLSIQPVIALDFIGRARGPGRYGNRTYDIQSYMEELKQFANDTGAAIFILAQINRSSDAKDFPDVSDISDSQSIEQNSDTLIIGHRPEYYGKDMMKDPLTGQDISSRNKMLARVVKCREGAPHDELWNVDMRYFRVWSRNMQFGEPYWEKYNEESFWREQLMIL